MIVLVLHRALKLMLLAARMLKTTVAVQAVAMTIPMAMASPTHRTLVQTKRQPHKMTLTTMVVPTMMAAATMAVAMDLVAVLEAQTLTMMELVTTKTVARILQLVNQ